MSKFLLRFFAVGAMAAVASWATAQSNVTFSVDMSQYSGTFTQPYVSGTFNNWCGNCNALADADGDGIWEGTFAIPNGTIEYKFTLDNWAGQENLANVGGGCTLTTSGFTNRIATISANTVMPTVCWESCSVCTVMPPADSVNITFQVNSANITVDPAGLFIAGGGTFGNPGDNPMSDADGDGIWTITVRLPKGMNTDYTFTNGNCPSWGCKENIAGQACAVAPFNDRRFYGAWADTTVSTCFGNCSATTTCPTPPMNINVTFLVDMSNQTVAASGVFIGGNFEGWNGAIAMTDANTDNIWEHTAVLQANAAYEWKFINGAGWAAPENFDSTHTECTITVGTFINRYLTTGSSDTTLPAFLFNSCDLFVGTRELFVQTGIFDIAPTLANEFTTLRFHADAINAPKAIRLMNATGQTLLNETFQYADQYRLDTQALPSGLYFVSVAAEGKIQTARIAVQH